MCQSVYPTLNWTSIRKKFRAEPIFSTRNRRILKIQLGTSVFYSQSVLRFLFPLSTLFTISYSTFLFITFSPVPFLCFVICSEQVVKAMMSEKVKLFKSIPSKWFQPNADVRASLLCCSWPRKCNTTGSVVYWTLPSLCPRNVAFECKLSFWVTVWLWAKHRELNFQCSMTWCALVAVSSAGDVEMSQVWNETHFQVIANTVSLCLSFLISEVEVRIIFI